MVRVGASAAQSGNGRQSVPGEGRQCETEMGWGEAGMNGEKAVQDGRDAPCVARVSA